LHTLV